MSSYLVIGARGNVGSEIVRLLSAQGHEVRQATSRKPEAPGDVQVNLLTREGLAQGLAGVDGAFLMAPPGHTRQEQLLNPVVDQAVAQGLKKVVLMTAMGANADPNSPLRQAELHLQASGLAWNVIRPNWFMQNFHTFWMHSIMTYGQIQLPVGNAKGSFIDVHDIAAVASKLLTSDNFQNREFDLTGAEGLDHDQVAAILSQVTGKSITYQDISPEAMRPALLQAGLPADYTEFLLTILGFFKAGYAAPITDAVKVITGVEPRRFVEYATIHRSKWLG